MKSFSKADQDSIRIANQAIADLAKAGATIVDPGPDGALFQLRSRNSSGLMRRCSLRSTRSFPERHRHPRPKVSTSPARHRGCHRS